MTKTDAKSPSAWGAEILAAFEAAVLRGGEVSKKGLTARIANAHALACHFDCSKLIGIAASKIPRVNYRKEISRKTGFELSETNYPYELGWVFVDPEKRGEKLSQKLVESCLIAAGPVGIFATTREDNKPMQRTLLRFGFVRVGESYKSDLGKVSLLLFVRDTQT